MSRPVDWAPLADSDPLPGDPDAVVAVARRHGDLAAELESQTAMLRRLATAEGWDADAGRAFASSVQDLAGRLDQARRRYSVAAQALAGYAPRLREAQAEGDAALRQAIEAQATIDRLEPSPAGSSPSAAPPAPVVVPPHQQQALQQARSDLARARNRLRSAQDARDAAGRTAARRIEDAISHDGLKDSFWDRVGDAVSDDWDSLTTWLGTNWNSFISWVHEHAGTLKWIADRCSIIATVLSGVALAISWIPGLDALSPFLLGAAAGLTGMALVCHALLACSGDGSLVDVALDLVALATFGYGSAAVKSFGAARVALRTEVMSATATKAALRTDQMAQQVEVLDRVLRSRTASAAAKRAARSSLRRLQRTLGRQVARNKGRVVEAMNVRPDLVDAVKYLDGQAAQGVRSVKKLRALAPDSARVQELADDARGLARRASKLNLTGLGTDLGDKVGHVFDPVKPVVQFGRYAGSS